KILSWNLAAAKIFGYAFEEVKDETPPFFEKEEMEGLIGKLLRAEDVKALEFNKKPNAGNPIPLLVTFSPIRNVDGDIMGVSAILKDITGLKKVERMKQEFLALVSHELRTPLTPIKGYLALLLGGQLGDLTSMQREAVRSVLAQSDHLQDMIETVIDVSRIEAGKPLELEREPLFMEEVIKESLGGLEPAFAAKKMKIELTPSSTRMAIVGDRKKILRVVDNLLGNALKFSSAGMPIRISVEGGDDAVKVTVADSGIGIDPQYLNRIFERFFQVDSSYTKASGGIGMGLAIAREIVEAHRGRIWAESDGPGRGSRFIFLLPVV
ncbi:PAS domain-containing sensor histidine kinase, partial [Candidatus Saganbacteria bacterium]|nr:PAS domain-containing sensor histidine kinase [Candidatus Saganbacteria bacterium]